MAKEPKKNQPFRSFSDVFGTEEFYPDANRVDIEDLINVPILISDAKILEDFRTESYGTHDVALLMFKTLEESADGFVSGTEESTTINSGLVFMDQIKRIMEKKNALPIVGVITKKQGTKNWYYFLT